MLDEYDAPTVEDRPYADRPPDDALPVARYALDRERSAATFIPGRTRLNLLAASVGELRIVDTGADARDESPAAGKARAVYDRTACAGTNVRSTGAIGRPP